MRDLNATQDMQFRFTAHLRDPAHAPAPAGIEERRIGVYRDLVYANMESFISSNFPVIRTLYADAEWESLAREFLREHRCHTPLFPEFGREFLRWLETRQEQGHDDPPFLLELAHYEWAELALSLDEADIDSLPHDPHGDVRTRVPVVSPLACVLAYHFPVHRISPHFRPAEAPAEPTLLLLVRGRDDAVRFHEINALSALLIERLQRNARASGSECLAALLADYDTATAANLRAAGEAMLRELKEREAILGTLPE
ncbi:MAG: putative DNA-binding domain-containing protein [Rudaea sp.]|uniref:HvfC family RiPP maturation protein n=1 Tax=Rudaea sp. TaxID=2136325 RepID=UPI0039E36863